MRRFLLAASAVLLLVGGAWGAVRFYPKGAASQLKPVANVGCWGDWCSGKDPQTTGCANGAITVSSVPIEKATVVPGTDQRYWQQVAILDLRWSPTCKTNWARLSVTTQNGVNRLFVTQDTGYEQSKATAGWLGDTYPGVFYTAMIYSPVARCRAWITGGSFSRSSTGWV